MPAETERVVQRRHGRAAVRVDIATKPRELAPHGRTPKAALNNSFGFGGHNVTLAFTAA